jgi:hypothetical protein
VLGLAMAAQAATDKVIPLVDDQQVASTLQQMHDDAEQIEQRSTDLVSGQSFEGRKTAILEKAREVKAEAVDMMHTYLGEDPDGLDGLEFITMAEAGEMGHWKVVDTLNRQVTNSELQELIDWALPLQERHFDFALSGSVQLAKAEDATEEA